MRWYAHSFKGCPEERWETQKQHGGRVARAAGERAAKFGLQGIGEITGWLHDLGKYVKPFQDFISGRSKAKRGPDHSSAGAVYAREQLGHLGAMVAHAVAGHHAGLKDGLLKPGGRLDNKKMHLQDVLHTAESDGFALPDPPVSPKLALEKGEQGFQLALLIRMLFSCLVDADRTETEAAELEANGEAPAQREFTAKPADIAAELRRSMQAQDEKREHEGTADTAINRLRARVLTHVANQANSPTGVFTLTVPTGGGKTLTSLRFALDHAVERGLDRVIVVIPFTSVIEQTTGIYREYLPSFVDSILEHHSNFEDDEAEGREEDEEGGLSPLRLAMENWAAPIIVTTSVQFFESIFGSRTSRCRKLHNVAKSVIVLDEAQTIPLHLLRPCVAALKELQRNYGCSIVLCTATQPALEERAEETRKRPEERRSFAGGFLAPRELAPNPEQLFRELDRVTIEHIGKQDDAALAGLLEMATQALCIVNSRGQARDLYAELKRKCPDGTWHLSTLMLPEHRRRVLRQIKCDLYQRRNCRVVSTSLVEAGVDFSFPLVLRAEAGLEQIIQAAGRCNRNWELGLDRKGRVLIFEAASRKPLTAMIANVEVAKETMRHHTEPHLPAAIEAYFQRLYTRRGPEGLDHHGLMEACNQKSRTLDFPFEQIAKEMRLIDDVTKPIIVPVDREAQDAITALRHAEKVGRLARQLQRFTVGLPPGVIEGLLAARAAEVVRQDVFGRQFVALTNLDLYKGDVGLTWDDPGFIPAEKLIV